MIRIESLALISAALSIIVAALSIWRANNSAIRRLVIIQKRSDSLLGLAISLQSRINDLEKFASVNHGYHVRDSSSQIEKRFLDSYGESDTGF